MKPIIKRPGGKTALLSRLDELLPKGDWRQKNRYFEPFAGGLALFLHVQPRRAVLADMDPLLITLYGAIKLDSKAVCVAHDDILRLHQVHTRGAGADHFYYHQRTLLNERAGTPAQQAARYLYINKTCFNGLHRVNADGEFNVPIGNYKKHSFAGSDEIVALSERLQGQTLALAPYRLTVADAQPGDVVYFDPPYIALPGKKSFVAYTKDGFSMEEQEKLAACAQGLAKSGVRVIASNSDTPETRRLWLGFNLHEVQVKRAVNSDGAGRGGVGELIITSY